MLQAAGIRRAVGGRPAGEGMNFFVQSTLQFIMHVCYSVTN